MERKAGMLALRGKRGEATAKAAQTESMSLWLEAEIIQKTQENSLLIQELEELRIEKKALEAKVKEGAVRRNDVGAQGAGAKDSTSPSRDQGRFTCS